MGKRYSLDFSFYFLYIVLCYFTRLIKMVLHLGIVVSSSINCIDKCGLIIGSSILGVDRVECTVLFIQRFADISQQKDFPVLQHLDPPFHPSNSFWQMFKTEKWNQKLKMLPCKPYKRSIEVSTKPTYPDFIQRFAYNRSAKTLSHSSTYGTTISLIIFFWEMFEKWNQKVENAALKTL